MIIWYLPKQTVAPGLHRAFGGWRDASSFGMIADIAARLERKVKWDPRKEGIIDDPEATALRTRPMRAPWNKELSLYAS